MKRSGILAILIVISLIFINSQFVKSEAACRTEYVSSGLYQGDWAACDNFCSRCNMPCSVDGLIPPFVYHQCEGRCDDLSGCSKCGSLLDTDIQRFCSDYNNDQAGCEGSYEASGSNPGTKNSCVYDVNLEICQKGIDCKWCADQDGDRYDTCDPNDPNNRGDPSLCWYPTPDHSVCIPMDADDGKPPDCDDKDPDEHPGVTWYYDDDGDGYHSSANDCERGSGDKSKWRTGSNGEDCNDNDLSINPAAEDIACDGIDQDCQNGDNPGKDTDGDGFVQESACPNADCNDGDASINPSASEVCDSIDNNCNGRLDEGCLCFNGMTQQCGTNIGACEFGQQTCSRGSWGNCEGGVNPAAELCDRLDNNCNGQTDEGCECFIEGQTQQCGKSDVGECEYGLQTCSGGRWSECAGNIDPSSDICDGADNDCNPNTLDGSAEQWFGQKCDGQDLDLCEKGTYSCKGKQYCTDDIGDSKEVCDSIDNDCDSSIDEGCLCSSGSTQECGTDVGQCEFGQQTCNSGAWGDCIGSKKPSAEACDGADNNCDGSTDENLLNACGKCGQLPAEACDGADNNCDGGIDEGCSCSSGEIQQCGTDLGVCEFGQQTCNNGAWSKCSGGVNGIPEICENGIDDNCNGAVDEGCTNDDPYPSNLTAQEVISIISQLYGDGNYPEIMIILNQWIEHGGSVGIL